MQNSVIVVEEEKYRTQKIWQEFNLNQYIGYFKKKFKLHLLSCIEVESLKIYHRLFCLLAYRCIYFLYVYIHALSIVYWQCQWPRRELESFRVQCIFHSKYVIRRVMTSRITYILQEVCNAKKEFVSMQKLSLHKK